MTTQTPPDQPIDPRLKDLLDLIREVPPRDPEAEARGRARYLAEVDQLFDGDLHPLSAGTRTSSPSTNSHRPSHRSIFRRGLAFTYLMAILTMVVILFGGAGVTAYAAQAALPGDALYPVKTGLELTQARLSRDAARQAQLYMNFAERRLDEIALLVAQGRFEDIDQAALEFETNVQRAINTLNIVAAGDPTQAQLLATQISNALTRYTEILRGMLTVVPDPVRPALEKAIIISETEGTGELEFEGVIDSITQDGWMISGRLVKSSPQTEIKGIIQIGMMVKVHALVSDDGSLYAREIEAVESEDELDSNENSQDDDVNDNQGGSGSSENDNDDEDVDDEYEYGQNTNENRNRNYNQNENSGNDNDDDDDDEDGNSNQNQNGNDNQENDNDNDNDDDDDDDVNQNDNGGNSNDNDEDDHDNDNNDND